MAIDPQGPVEIPRDEHGRVCWLLWTGVSDKCQQTHICLIVAPLRELVLHIRLRWRGRWQTLIDRESRDMGKLAANRKPPVRNEELDGENINVSETLQTWVLLSDRLEEIMRIMAQRCRCRGNVRGWARAA